MESDGGDVFDELLRREAPPGACRLAVDATLGRHLVATRSIPAGDVFLRCESLIAGPKATGDAVCLGCCRPLGPGPRYACEGCGWPLCSAACGRAPGHRDECVALAAAPDDARPRPASTPPAHWYAGVLPLRCLQLQGLEGRAVRALQSHLGERTRASAAYRGQGLQRRAAGFVARVLDVPEEEALRMAAVLDTNAFDVGRDGVEARALFGSVSMLAHDCQANARCAMLGELELGVLAQRDIAPGDVVCISYYADSLRGPLERRRHLRATKCFDCSCARCSDPADLGLHLDSIRCIRCRPRAGTPLLLVSTAALDSAADWRCPRCAFTLSAEQMLLGHRRLRAQVDALNGGGGGDPARAEAFLAEHLGPGGLLHATSAHILRVKHDLLGGAYAFIPGCTPALAVSDDRLERATAMCVDMLEVVSVLEPGLSVLRGSLLLRLLGLLLERARRGGARENVHHARRLFREAEVIFMDLDTKVELRKRKKIMEMWIGENIKLEDEQQEEEGRAAVLSPR
ncbi:uncharacterized protein LOC113203826 [Frankliniella occidentalis]|uniref:Uncharacterized protein LOC113203826 n=1 Tax=Frankliniella occidentalis TaxID=133901 RepID=A0A9C6XSU7_FRAOC|nr:uncharacterized protein LOC113203826 [Frankliniella occidentalis]